MATPTPTPTPTPAPKPADSVDAQLPAGLRPAPPTPTVQTTRPAPSRPAPPSTRPAPPQRSGQPSTPVATRPSRLGAVKRGLLREAKRFYFYGPEGVGKTSLAADADSIVLDIDRGSGHVDVKRYPFRDGDDGHIAESLDEVYGAIDDLLVHPHDHKALAIDTADALEALVWRKVCEGKHTKSGDKIEGIEDFGFGKGYNIAADEWRRLLHRLDALRIKRGMHIIFIGHSLVKSFKNPVGDDYDRYRPKLDDRALGLLREWCEVIGYVAFDDIAKRNAGATRARGVSTGYRVIQLEHNAAWDAKSRLPLPSQIDLRLERPWLPFEQAIEALYSATPDSLRAKIDAELDRLGEDLVRPDGKETTGEAVRAAVAAAGDDVSILSKYHIVLTQSQTKEQTP